MRPSVLFVLGFVTALGCDRVLGLGPFEMPDAGESTSTSTSTPTGSAENGDTDTSATTTSGQGGAEPCAPPAHDSGTCGNCERDGDETDVDCGGKDCPACEPGKMCLVHDDCANGACLPNGTCH